MLHQYIRAGKGFILVYAVNNRTSFDELKTKFYNTVMKYVKAKQATNNRNWIEFCFQSVIVSDCAICRVKEVDHVPLVLIGNKSDLDASERQISTQEGEDLAKEWRVPFFGNISLIVRV